MLERPEKKTPPDRAREGVTGIEPAACLVYLGRWTHVVDVECDIHELYNATRMPAAGGGAFSEVRQ